jgi:hypothetical protein
MRIVALQAIANRRRMNGALDLGGILVGVAGETEPVGSGRDQLHAGHVLVHPNLVTTQAAHRDGGMDEFAFRLILVAFQALGSVNLRIQRNGMNRGVGARKQQHHQRKKNQGMNTSAAAVLVYDSPAEPNAMGEQSHTASNGCICTKITVSQKNCRAMQRARNSLHKIGLRDMYDPAQALLGIIVNLENGPSATASS